MLVTIAGAMSTAELGITLAEMIREDKIHAIVCTGANLEEDIFNLVAHDYDERVPAIIPPPHDGRRAGPARPAHEPRDRHMHPRDGGHAPHRGRSCFEEWVKADQAGERFFPHEFMFKILRGGKLKQSYQIDPKNSWMLAASEKNIPMIVPAGKMRRWATCLRATSISGRREERPTPCARASST